MNNISEIKKYTKNLTLLYAEDDQDAREMTAMIFEEFFSNVIVAIDGEDGYEKFISNTIDLVITDINMPKINGLDLIKKIRQKDSDIPVIILSARNEDNFFIDSIHYGVNGYLLKPIDINQLSSTIQRVTQKYIYIKEAKANLHLLKEYEKATNESSIVSKIDIKGYITYINDAFCKISCYKKEELIGKSYSIVHHPDNPKDIFKDIWHTVKDEKRFWKGVIKNLSKDGKSYFTQSIIMPIVDLDGQIIEYISLCNDITDIMNPTKQLENEIENTDDPLLIYFKLEDFNIIEEFYDKETLEELEKKVANHIERKLSKFYHFEKFYHLEHGEYAIVLRTSQYKDDMENFIKKLKKIQTIIKTDKINLNLVEYDIAVIISIAYEKEKILRSVKIGIKKLINTNKTFILSNNLASMQQQKAKENMKILSIIKNAIHCSKIVSFFQPIVDNNTQKIVKYESLVRLITEENKILTPFFFLEAAKKGNYYYKITNIVLEYSFIILAHCNVDISINLSALDIEDKKTRETILKLLSLNKKDAKRVIFELLEDERIKDFDIVEEFISTVKTYGVKIAIDDFGAGYSNFERLLKYQPDILKIDGCLIRNIETSSYSQSVVKSIVTFAKEQNLQTVAEFIENKKIYKIVKDLGVDFSQGYYFGKPKPFR